MARATERDNEAELERGRERGDGTEGRGGPSPGELAPIGRPKWERTAVAAPRGGKCRRPLAYHMPSGR